MSQNNSVFKMFALFIVLIYFILIPLLWLFGYRIIDFCEALEIGTERIMNFIWNNENYKVKQKDINEVIIKPLNPICWFDNKNILHINKNQKFIIDK